MNITLARLKELHACSSQVALFQQHFGESVTVTKERCLAVASIFDWNWAAQFLLSLFAQTEYYRACTTAWAEYYRTYTTAWAEYYKVRAPARAEYDKAYAIARAEYDKACAIAFFEASKLTN